MSTLALPIEGSCRCGGVQMRVSAAPILTMACHCKGCQKMTASAFSLSAAVPPEGFTVSRGEPVIGGMRNPDLKHFFCPDCMSWLFTHFAPKFVNVRSTMFEGLADIAPYIETWTKTKLPWVSTLAVHRYEEFPAPSDFGQLMQGFVEWRAHT